MIRNTEVMLQQMTSCHLPKNILKVPGLQLMTRLQLHLKSMKQVFILMKMVHLIKGDSFIVTYPNLRFGYKVILWKADSVHLMDEYQTNSFIRIDK